MSFVSFESITGDGTLIQQIIPRASVRTVRSLTAAETEFARRLASGFFDVALEPKSAYATLQFARAYPDASQALIEAKRNGSTVTHRDTQSIIETVYGEKFCLTKSIPEIVQSAPDILELVRRSCDLTMASSAARSAASPPRL